MNSNGYDSPLFYRILKPNKECYLSNRIPLHFLQILQVFQAVFQVVFLYLFVSNRNT